MSNNSIDGWLSELVRPAIWNKEPYSPARGKPGDNAPKKINLNMNESPYSPAGPQTNCYGEQQPQTLRDAMADLYGVSAHHLLLTRGSTEAIDTLVRLFCRENIDDILICPPTYGYYQDAAKTQGANIMRAPLDPENDYQLDVGRILETATENTKIVFIPSPNNPLGNLMDAQDMLALCKARKGRSVVVADEAYIDFSPDPRGLLSSLAEQDNLVILRSLSKSYGLAGERVGCILGHPRLLEMAQKVMQPYMFSISAVKNALWTVSDAGARLNDENRAVTILERKRLTDILAKSADVEYVFPSVANFVTVRVTDGNEEAFLRKASSQGIALRSCANHGLPGCVRITVGTPQENSKLLSAFVPKSEIYHAALPEAPDDSMADLQPRPNYGRP